MLSLSTLHTILSQILSPPSLHTAILFTPSGQLISYASNTGNGKGTPRPKDDIRVLVGLGGELWGETKDDGVGMVDSELGRIVVVPITEPPNKGKNTMGSAPVATPKPSNPPKPSIPSTSKSKSPTKSPHPLMLLALNSTDDVAWEDMQSKAKSLAIHLSPPLHKYREYLTVVVPPPSTTAPPSAVVSPAPVR